MTFVLIGLLFTGGCAALFRRLGVPYAYSKGLFMAISLSLLAVICLAQNYTQNLIQDPRVNDGISITNHIAYWINGGDNWSIHSFKLSFQQSIYVTLFLLAAYPFTVLLDRKWHQINGFAALRCKDGPFSVDI